MDPASEIPGMKCSPGRRYIYVEALRGKNGTTTQKEFSSILKARIENGRSPLDGGMIYDECRIVCPDGRQLYSFTFRGDLDGWQKLIDDYATAKAAATGVIREGGIELNDGTFYRFDECSITLDCASPEPRTVVISKT